MKQIFLILLAAFVDISAPENNIGDDPDTAVYNAHLEIYQKLHRQLTLMQIITQGSTKEIASNFPLQANASLVKLAETHESLKTNLNDQIQNLLGSIKLSTDVYQIESCINDSNFRFDELIAESHRNFNECISSYMLEIDRVSSLVNEIFSRQVKEYNNLENVFNFCHRVSKNPQYLHQCLYNQFYVDHTIVINELKVKTREIIEEYFGAFASGGDHLDSCTKNLLPKSHEKMYQIIDVFKICLQVNTNRY